MTPNRQCFQLIVQLGRELYERSIKRCKPRMKLDHVQSTDASFDLADVRLPHAESLCEPHLRDSRLDAQITQCCKKEAVAL